MLTRLQEFHRSEIEPLLGAPIGASEEEVRDLEARLGFGLPATYRELLLWMGNDTDGALVGSDCFVRHIESNNRWLPELLAENSVAHPLPERYVTFFMHQGYIPSVSMYVRH